MTNGPNNRRESSNPDNSYSFAENEHDLLFFVTEKSEWVLITFGDEGPKQVSKIMLEAADFPPIDLNRPPLFYHLSEYDKVIGALLHKNLLHVIPIILINGQYKLSDPITIYVGESDVEDLIALNTTSTTNMLQFAYYESIDLTKTSHKISVYQVENKETVAKSRDTSPFNKDFTDQFNCIASYTYDGCITKLTSLPFGGFIVFTPLTIMYFSSRNYTKPYYILGVPEDDISKVQWVEFMDHITELDTYEEEYFRILFSTVDCKIYLLMFNISDYK